MALCPTRGENEKLRKKRWSFALFFWISINLILTNETSEYSYHIKIQPIYTSKIIRMYLFPLPGQSQHSSDHRKYSHIVRINTAGISSCRYLIGQSLQMVTNCPTEHYAPSLTSCRSKTIKSIINSPKLFHLPFLTCIELLWHSTYTKVVCCCRMKYGFVPSENVEIRQLCTVPPTAAERLPTHRSTTRRLGTWSPPTKRHQRQSIYILKTESFIVIIIYIYLDQSPICNNSKHH